MIYNNSMTKVILKRNEGRTISAGGLWVFDNEIDTIDGLYINGDIVEVDSFKGDFIGYGYINDNSKIRIRILSTINPGNLSESENTKRQHVVSITFLR